MQTFVSPQAQEMGRREQEDKAKRDAVLQKFASRSGGGPHGFGGGMGGM